MYDLILADPPWRYSFSRSKSRKIENQYQTMTLMDICNLPVEDLCAEDCVLYLWATAPKLLEALRVMEAWGFEYTTQAVWDKKKIGMGYYFRGRHEILLIGKRGKPKPPPPSARGPSVIEEPRSRHSAKPEASYVALEEMYPEARKVELFARKPRPGWDRWGNEVDNSIQLETEP